MQLLQPGWAVASTAWLLVLLTSPAEAEMGDYTKGLQDGKIPLAEVVLIVGAALAVLSVLILLVALVELTGRVLMTRCCGGLSYSIAHIVLATLWLPVVGISIYLITQKHYPAVAFVAAGAVFIAAHAALAMRQLCWFCCAGALMGSSIENPKSALLKAQDTGGQGRASSPIGGEAATAGCDQFNPVAGVHGVGAGGGARGLESHNPFHATYGLLPGSSVFAYQIFIPGSEEHQAGARWGPPSSSRQGSPGSEGRQTRTSAQPLVQLPSARLRQ